MNTFVPKYIIDLSQHMRRSQDGLRKRLLCILHHAMRYRQEARASLLERDSLHEKLESARRVMEHAAYACQHGTSFAEFQTAFNQHWERFGGSND